MDIESAHYTRMFQARVNKHICTIANIFYYLFINIVDEQLEEDCKNEEVYDDDDVDQEEEYD